MMLPCPFHQLTGLDCPFCGMQRSFVELLNGNLIEAFMLNPIIWCLMPYGGIVVMCSVRQQVRMSKIGVWAMSNNTIGIVFIILLLWGILRNIL